MRFLERKQNNWNWNRTNDGQRLRFNFGRCCFFYSQRICPMARGMFVYICRIKETSFYTSLRPLWAEQRRLLLRKLVAKEAPGKPGRAGAEKCSKKEASLCLSTVYIKDMEQNSGDSRGSIGFSRAGLRNISRR